jgi:hypothetical protein
MKHRGARGSHGARLRSGRETHQKRAAVETSADMRPGVGEICLTERDGE